MSRRELVFDGAIAGLGSASGNRLVVGLWARSPFGAFVDVMRERPDGHRVLYAPSEPVGDFVGSTYRFDETRVEPVVFSRDGDTWRVQSSSLDLAFQVGARTGLGRLLVLVPRRLARARWWCRAIDPAARVLVRGVRTYGTAGGERREYYCALDQHAIGDVQGSVEGVDLGPLRPVVPAVRFGFASTPPRPSIVRVTTRITLSCGDPANTLKID